MFVECHILKCFQAPHIKYWLSRMRYVSNTEISRWKGKYWWPVPTKVRSQARLWNYPISLIAVRIEVCIIRCSPGEKDLIVFHVLASFFHWPDIKNFTCLTSWTQQMKSKSLKSSNYLFLIYIRLLMFPGCVRMIILKTDGMLSTTASSTYYKGVNN